MGFGWFCMGFLGFWGGFAFLYRFCIICFFSFFYGIVKMLS